MKKRAFITILLESNCEDDFKNENHKNNKDGEKDTFNNLDDLLKPLYSLKGLDAITPIYIYDINDNISQSKDLRLTIKAYKKHIQKLRKNLKF